MVRIGGGQTFGWTNSEKKSVPLVTKMSPVAFFFPIMSGTHESGERLSDHLELSFIRILLNNNTPITKTQYLIDFITVPEEDYFFLNAFTST